MLRRLHSLPGLLLAVMLVVTATTGTILSFDPVLDRISNPVASGTSVAALAEAVAARHVTVDRITVRPTGAVTASYTDGEEAGVERVDPATGTSLGPYQVSGFTRFVTDLHRSFLLGDAGRIGSGIGAVAMLVLTVSGTMLLARRAGAWRALLRPIRGTAAQRWHVELSRLAAVGLALTSLTGVWMSAETFGLVPETINFAPSFVASRGPPASIGSLAALQAVDISELRDLTFPAPDGRADVFTLKTAKGDARIDQATGSVLAFTSVTALERIQEIVRLLHTGRGAWMLGLLLGLSAACVPVLGLTGGVIWWRRRASRGYTAIKTPIRSPDTMILVGSEGNGTWGFANTLHTALTNCGHKVQTSSMNDFASVPPQVERVLILASTYGDGAAPASAKDFLTRIRSVPNGVPVAVLGFGDRNFPKFCRFAQDVSEALDVHRWPRLLPLKRVDRQSAQEFAQWGRDLGCALGHDLALEHVSTHPRTCQLELVARDDYGAAVGSPIAILSFRAPPSKGKPTQLPVFEAGDLVGILPPGNSMPRFYSLASSTGDGVLEICVRLREGGICSTFLHTLAPGARIEAFIRGNPTFRPARGKSPLVLIGAGAGIGPLAGFVRANRAKRPVHLYWGGRSPSSDFLYEHELAMHLTEQRLTSLNTAFSRSGDGAYVQDRIAADAARLRELIRHGAQVLVCGGREMAESVTQTIESIVRPLGLDLATLKSTGRYLEDVY